MNIFSPEGGDQSLNYLAMIFGAVGDLLPPASNPNMLLSWIFKVINSSVLTLGTLLVVYVTVVGVLQTAHEGEFMGKKWSGLWVPIRMVMGIVAMFPVSSGYSSLQIVVMWIVVQGIGAADQVWTQALQYTNTFGSPFSPVVDTSNAGLNIQGQFPKLFQSIVCQAHTYAPYTNTRGTNNDTHYYYCDPNGGNKSDSFCPKQQPSQSTMLNITNGPQVVGQTSTEFNTALCTEANSDGVCPPDNYTIAAAGKNNQCCQDRQVTYNIGPGGSCGKLQYPNCKATCDSTKGGDVTSLDCMACQAQPAALQAIVTSMGAIAQKFAAMDNDYLTWTSLKPSQSISASGGGGYLSPQPPTWITSFCSARGIEAGECCSTKSVPPQVSCVTQPISGTQTCTPIPGSGDRTCGGYNLFNSTDPANEPRGPDYNNTSKGALVDAYEPYGLTDYVGGIDFIEAMKNNWLSRVVVAPTTAWMSNQAPQALSGWMQQAQRSGWILAGGYYYNLVRFSKTAVSIPPVTIKFTTQPIDQNGVIIRDYRNNYTRGNDFASDMKSGGGNNSQYGEVQALYGDVSAAMLRGLKNGLTDDGKSNPLVKIATFGQSLMVAAQIIWGLLAVLIPVMVGVMTANFMVLGTGMPITPWGEAIKAFFSFIGPYIFLLLASMFSLGALLGIYVPAIPYIIFTASAIGWFIGVIEAMVAAPFVALGILSPAGQHEILGRSEPAVMMMFNIFLRPSLMIVGLLAGMLLATVGVKFLNAGFMSVVSNVMNWGGGATSPAGSTNNIGPFEQIVWIALYGSLLMTILNKCFSLIHYLPEKVLTWIGGQAVSYGEGEMAGEAKRGAEAAGSAMGGAAKGGVESGVKAAEGAKERGEAGRKSNKEREEAAKPPAPTAKGST